MTPTQHSQVCIAGGGPAGIMLGYLLARAGADVVVLEKHKDFFRDFRGDTIHPSTLELMDELGLLDEFLQLPHQKVRVMEGLFGDTPVTIADFRGFKGRCPYIALMPQWDFLNFLAGQGKKYPGFHLYMEAEAQELLRENGVITGARVKTPDGVIDIHADLTVACDGRHSALRACSGLEVKDFGAPIDVLWFRLPYGGQGPTDLFARFDAGIALIFIYRGDYWQCGLVIEKDTSEKLKQRGIGALRQDIIRLAPFVGEGVNTLTSWDDLKPLSVQINRLKRWHLPGFLCIGDAAHAMSPVGGVGVNLAVQDAVAAANILYPALRDKKCPDEGLLHAVQRRRTFPVAVIQRLQAGLQDFIFRRVLSAGRTPKPPLAMRLLTRFPALRRVPGRLVGWGIRPEHIKTPDIQA